MFKPGSIIALHEVLETKSSLKATYKVFLEITKSEPPPSMLHLNNQQLKISHVRRIVGCADNQLTARPGR